MKTKLIEKAAIEGAYGALCDLAIVEHKKHGRILIAQEWTGGDVVGYTYRWGVAAKLQDDDTMAWLLSDSDYPCHNLVFEEVIYAEHPDRPVLNLEPPNVQKIADSVNL